MACPGAAPPWILASAFAALIAAAGPAPAAADGGEPSHRQATATRTTSAPHIDGRLDDPAWQAAAPERELRQRSPDEDRPPTEPTELSVLYDDHRLSGAAGVPADALTGREQASYGLDGQWQSGSGVWRALGQAVASQPLGPPRLVSGDGRPCAPEGPDCARARRVDGTLLGAAGYGAAGKLSRISDHAIATADGAVFSPALDLDGVGFQNELGKARGHALVAYRDTRFTGPVYRNFGIGAFADVQVDHRGVPIERLVGLDHVAELKNAASFDGTRCVESSAVRTYRFARLDAGSVSLTGRAAAAFRPDLSFDIYAQLFFAQGDYHRYQSADVTGAERLARAAFAPLAATDATDATDAEIAQLDAMYDFATASLDVNAVLRWELRKGSSLYLVYTRRQSGDGLSPERFPAIHPSRLGGGPVVDTAMVKLQLFWRAG